MKLEPLIVVYIEILEMSQHPPEVKDPPIVVHFGMLGIFSRLGWSRTLNPNPENFSLPKISRFNEKPLCLGLKV